MKHVDCRGMQCPKPLIMTRDALLDGDNEIETLVDNPVSLENVSRFLTKAAFAVTPTQDEHGVWHIYAKREGDAPLPDAESNCSLPGKGKEAKTLVLITTETLGRGDDTLGAGLMKNFLSTLTEMPGLWRLVFLNGGVKLTATPGATLDAIKKLAASGVSVLVCGTCLSHYGLLEKKEVGETSNMLDIVTSLSLADKVIRP